MVNNRIRTRKRYRKRDPSLRERDKAMENLANAIHKLMNNKTIRKE